LVDDGGAIDMLKVTNRYDEIYLFLVHNVLKVQVVEHYFIEYRDKGEGKDD